MHIRNCDVVRECDHHAVQDYKAVPLSFTFMIVRNPLSNIAKNMDIISRDAPLTLPKYAKIN